MSSSASMSSQAMQSAAPASVSAASLWIGRILSGLVVLFLLFDGITKVMRVSYVLAANTQLGLPENLVIPIGITLLVCTAFYVIPQTAFLGAILLTGYLGGAVAIQLRVGHPLFSQTLFPVYFGALVWLSLYLREGRLRPLIPFRS